MAQVRFEGVWKMFGPAPAVADLNLDVHEGEFLVFVGPSGCGKTTSLRMLAGLERPTYGRIWIGDRVVNTIPPGKRDIAMVFQSYALYPHMSIYENLAFGPKVRHEKKTDMRQRIQDVAKTLGIEELLNRKPSALSGGQRQRVALGRALIRHPQLFLLDEPLSNLDAALRVQMRAELIHLHREFKVTTVYVTHDQVEAMTMGDRIAVMAGGVLQQVASPEMLYDDPANLFVATFIGSPKMNLFPGELIQENGRTGVRFLGATVMLPPETPLLDGHKAGRALKVGIRPADLEWSSSASDGASARFCATADIVEPLGAETYVTATVEGIALISRFPSRAQVHRGETIELAFNPKHLYLFDEETGERIIDRSALVVPEDGNARPDSNGAQPARSQSEQVETGGRT